MASLGKNNEKVGKFSKKKIEENFFVHFIMFVTKPNTFSPLKII